MHIEARRYGATDGAARRGLLLGTMTAVIGARITAAQAAAPHIPRPDCTAHVGYELNTDLPGYRLPTWLVAFRA
jgi:hypothetical protein